MSGKRNYFIILLMLLIGIAYGQKMTHIGLPFLKYFPYDEYNANPQNWDAVQAPNGKMYFANGDGVLEFDGNWWRLIELPNKTVARSLDIDNNGTIYVGGYEEFGRLRANKKGVLEYESLLYLLPEGYDYFQDVWTTHVINNRAFFQTSTAIFAIKNDSIEIFKAGWEYAWASVAHDHFFTHDAYYALKMYANGELIKLKGADRFIKERIYNVLNYRDNSYLIATEKGNYFICDIDTLKGKLEIKDSINNPTTEQIKKNYHYTGINYNNENLCISTYYGGVFLCDMSLNSILNLNESFGLNNNNITNIYEDQNHNIWLTMDRGITLVNMNLSITTLNKFSNVNGSIKDAIIYDNPNDKIPNRLYAASIEGLFYKDLNETPNPLDKTSFQKFKPYRGFREETWSLFEYNNMLLSASTYGSFEIKDNVLHKISWRPARSFTIIKDKPNTLIVNLENGLEVIQHKKGKWTSQGKIAGSNGFISYSFFDSDGFLWTESVKSGVYRIKLSNDLDTIISRKSYSVNKGLPSATLNYPYLINDEVKVATDSGIYRYNKTLDTFIPDRKLNQWIGKEAPDYLVQTPNKNIWYISSRTKTLGELVYQKDGSYKKDTAQFNHVRKQSISSIYFYDDSTVFLSSSNGLIVYDKKKRKKRSSVIQTQIHKVEIINNPNTIYAVKKTAIEDSVLILTSKQNAIRFSFAATSFVSAYKNQFSFYLEGFDKTNQWSDWSSQPVKEYNYLKEGEYTLHVRSRDLQMNRGNTIKYHFEILPPWYRTVWAYISYLILVIIILYLYTILNSRRLKRANIKLENKVKIRTKELRSQKKKITDSIEYALQIQKAILPSDDVIKEITPDFFIYYEPKDIVSGDFYWHSKGEEIHYFATVDCTGHGVPGGFMSMIGNTLLNELVVHDKVLQPSKILDAMNSKLHFILSQSDKDTGANTDGMTLSLIKIDTKNKIITVASAMQSVLIIENDVLRHIKADLYEIGDIFLNSEKTVFNEQSFNYENGCQVYMFTDGFTDQFGENKNQKYTFGRFRNLLFKIKDLSMADQKKQIELAFETWKGNNKQIDDVTVVGFRL